MRYGIGIIITSTIYITIDYLFIGILAASHYQSLYGDLLRPINGMDSRLLLSAGFVYLLIITGIYTFVLPRANNSMVRAGLFGALYGGIVYGVYDFTSYAITRDWSLILSLFDMTWGMIICSFVATLGLFFSPKDARGL